MRVAGKPPGHIASGNQCEQCHTTVSWATARFDHSSVTADCATCHNGSTATGKPANHIQTSASCADCHTTTAWSPARFDHSTVTAACATCHSHDCVECHNTTAWTTTYTHTSSAFPAGHRQALGCTDCHIGNAEANLWRTAASKPYCAGCHAANFQPGEHKEIASPSTNYTVSELRDCTGARHTYTDATLIRIQTSRTGQSFGSAGAFAMASVRGAGSGPPNYRDRSRTSCPIAASATERAADL